MLTRCPACATHFRVTTEQLKARSGRVRCGACQEVFNALDGLIEEPMLMVAPAGRESAQSIVPPSPLAAEAEAIVHPEDEVDELALLGLEAQETSIFEAAAAVDPAAPESETTEPVAAEPDTAAEADAGAPDWSEVCPEPPRPPRRWPWLVGSLVALAALGLQATLAFRVELAVLWPEVKPALVALCGIAGCEVGLPAKVGLVGIEASDLHPDGEHAGRLALTATLKNRAPFTQQFPHLELTLTDTADQAIARKIMAPADYLPASTPFAKGMQPNADVMVAVGVEPDGLTASGYRLYLFYP